MASKLHQRRALAILLTASFSASSTHAAKIGDVFVIALENHNFTQPSSYTSTQAIQGNLAAPFINSLITPGNANAANVSYATNYTNSGTGVHPSEPNYIWSEAGSNYNPATSSIILSDNDPSSSAKNIFTTPHLTGLMNSAGVSWKNYQEDYQRSGSGAGVSASGTLPGGATNPYNGSTLYSYGAKHDPMAFFSDTATQNLAPISQLATDLSGNTVGKYNWITPDLYNDMHTGLSAGFTYHGTHYTGDQAGVAQGDNFLSIVVPLIEASSAYQNNGAIIIWNDETEGGDTTSFNGTEIVISPLAKGNAYASSVPLNHSSDIRTMQEIFGLGPTYLNNLVPSNEYSPANGSSTVNSVVASNDLSSLFQSGVISPLPVIWSGSTGNWSNTANWTGGIVPAQTNVEVKIDNGSPNASDVNLDVNASVGDLVVDTNDLLAIDPGKTLTLNGPTTTLLNGTLVDGGTLNAVNITIGPAGNLNVSAGTTLAISGSVVNQHTATLNGSLNFSAGSTLNNTAGTATFGTDSSALGGANLSINAAGGSVVFATTQHLAGLNISYGATVSVTGGSAGHRSILFSPALSVIGKLDLTTNCLDLQNGGSVGLTAITTLIHQGFNNGTWTGNGISSSTASGDSSHLLAVGVIENNQGGSIHFNASNPFETTTPNPTDILARLTYYGDANLDGQVTSADYALIDSGFLSNGSSAGWYNGDFNYDSVINGSDYTLIDNGFNTQGAALTGQIANPTAAIAAQIADTTAVPEPAALGLLTAAIAMLGRRRVSYSTN